ERTAVAARAPPRTEQLVAKITVARLDVDERKAGIARQARGGGEALPEPRQLVVRNQSNAVRKPAVENLVRGGGERRRSIVDIRTRITARGRRLPGGPQHAVGG